MVLSLREHKGIDLDSENHVQELNQVRLLIGTSKLSYVKTWTYEHSRPRQCDQTKELELRDNYAV